MVAPVAHERRTSRIAEMMNCLRIDPDRSVGPRLSVGYETAFQRCKVCEFKKACRNWLDACSAPAMCAPRFCPNADILFELSVESPSWVQT